MHNILGNVVKYSLSFENVGVKRQLMKPNPNQIPKTFSRSEQEYGAAKGELCVIQAN